MKPGVTALGERDVHVFAIPLAVPSRALEAAMEVLCAEELERASRFRFDQHRRRFIVARAALRHLLAAYLARGAANLRFTYGSHGKPALDFPVGRDPLCFNISHSGDLALAAVSRRGPLGVDVEHIRPVKDADDLVARFFSERENALYRELPSEQRPEAFFNLWTRKEALLKATGEGISGGLNRVEVSFLPRERAELLAIGGSVDEAREWQLQTFAPVEGWTAAVAIRSRGMEFHAWKYQAGEMIA